MIIWEVAGPWLTPMALLIILSAFFSGSEAALFSLQASDRRKLLDGSSVGNSLSRLFASTEQLLSAVLFWNLVINMAYFGIASIVATRLQNTSEGSIESVVFTLGSLLAIIFFSEMLPKSIAVKSASRSATLVAFPLELALAVVRPFLPALSFCNLIARRILWPNFQPEPDLEVRDIDRAIRLSATDQAFAARERSMLSNLVAFADVRVNHLMTPHSYYDIHQLPVSPTEVEQALESGGYLFLGPENGDAIEGVIALRWLRPSQMDDIHASVEKPLVVPWSSSVADTLESLRRKSISVAVIVNEYGENIGILTIDEILDVVLQAETTVSTRQLQSAESEEASREPLRMLGSTRIREVAKQLDAAIENESNVTLTGLLQRLNRRIPREGDTCYWQGYRLTVVHEVDKDIEIELVPERDNPSDGQP